MKKLVINTSDAKSVINKNIYGHFSEHLGRCIYGGLYVGEGSDIPNKAGMRAAAVDALRHIRAPVLRWPGGCFADEYHWMDGIGPAGARKRMVNTHWGGVTEDNSFGTHEFMELCEQIGCEPYVNGNLGSGTVREMSEWVEYMTGDGLSPMSELRKQNGRADPWKLKYFCVGNENWGCGGNMRPEFYADQYRRYQTYLRSYGGNKIYKIACGANSFDYDWTDKVMANATRYMDAISLHYYTVPFDWRDKGSATDFGEDAYYMTLQKGLRMEELISRHLGVMDKYDQEHRVGVIVDEWGAWYNVEPGTNPGFLYQQNTMRDAVLAALTFDIFNAHADRVVMANIAQTVNVLQSVILTEGDKTILTPTYHVFDLYKEHQDATAVSHWIESDEVGAGDAKVPRLSATASIKGGTLTATITNTSATENASIDCELIGVGKALPPENICGKVLMGAINAMNDFDSPDKVTIKSLEGIEATSVGAGNCANIRFTLPACSVAAISLKL
ncbi:MAG: alpha-N-arabinofuranosidase [Oscillospiraceae bacterium]|nr:alpha-N-arabinofuranosidase [Oscillospiraceae bacterium]